MRISRAWGGLLVGVMLLTAGCASTGGGQLENTIYDSHRRIVKLDQGLEGSVSKLNETTAELIARVNQSDQEMRTLRSMLEENQVKLETIQRTVDNLAMTLHQQFNLSPPASAGAPGFHTGPSEVEVRGVRVSPPPETVPRPTTGRPDGAPSLPDSRSSDLVSGDYEADYQRAQKSYANEDYALALQQFDAYLQRYPNTELCANAQFWKGYCYYNLGNHDEAIAEFERLRANFPADDKVPFGMHIQAMAHKQLGQTQRAIALLKEVVGQYPDTAAGVRSKTELEKLQGN